MTDPVALDTGGAASDKQAVQSRTLKVLWVSSVLSRGAVSAIFAVAVLALKDLLDGNTTWAGLSTAATTVGSAAAAFWLGTFMQRRGRTPGLTYGFGIAVLGAIAAVVGLEARTTALFLLGMVLIGVGSGTSNLSRYAAADLAEPERRSRDISSVVFFATFGAVAFPLLVGPVNAWAGDLGFNERSGGMAMGGIFMVGATIAIFGFLRPDPLVVAGGVDGDASRSDTVPFREALGIAWRHPLARLAFVALVVGQAVMVMVMAMTPLHMEAHGHGDGIIGAVISAHTLGMFAFAPLAGYLSDRIGRVPTIVLAGATLLLATVLTALAGEAPKLLMFPGLYLLGLGWSFGIVAGSALLTETVDEGDRVAVQGAADTATNVASGVGALASGMVVDMAGFHILSMIGMAAAGALMAQSWFEQRLAVG